MSTLTLPPLLTPRYRAVSRLGSGAYGQVLRAQDQELDRPVAIKLLRDSVQDPDQVARFEREARVTSQLNHPNVVQVYDYGVDAAGTAYIVYELIDGETLFERLRREALSPARVREVGVRLAGALQVAHRVGILHRDLKPQNVLLRRHGQPVLCDFGIARAQSENTCLTAEGVILGTLDYLDPQVLLGAAPSTQSDCYGLAATLFQARFGAPVYPGVDARELLRLAQDGVPPRCPSPAGPADPGLDAALVRALDPNPARRFRDLEAFAACLGAQAAEAPRAEGLRTGETVITKLPPQVHFSAPATTARTRRPGRSFPGHLGVAATVTLACLGVGFWSKPAAAPPAPVASPVRSAVEAIPAELLESYERFVAFHEAPGRPLASTLNRDYAAENSARMAEHLLDPRFPLRANRFYKAFTQWLVERVEAEGPEVLDRPVYRRFVDQVALFTSQTYTLFNVVALRRGLTLDASAIGPIGQGEAIRAFGNVLEMAKPYNDFLGVLDPLRATWAASPAPQSVALLTLRGVAVRGEHSEAVTELTDRLTEALLAEPADQANVALLRATLRLYHLKPLRDPEACERYATDTVAMHRHVEARLWDYPRFSLGEDVLRIHRGLSTYFENCAATPPPLLASLPPLLRYQENASFALDSNLFSEFERFRWAYRNTRGLDEAAPDPPTLAASHRVREKWDRYGTEDPTFRRRAARRRTDTLAGTAAALDAAERRLAEAPDPSSYLEAVLALIRWFELRRLEGAAGRLSEAAKLRLHSAISALLDALSSVAPAPGQEGAGAPGPRALLRSLGARLDPAVDAPTPCLQADLARLVQAVDFPPLRPLTEASCPHP